MFGEVTNKENERIKDMNLREIAYMLPILVFIVWIGVYPQPFLRKMDASVTSLLEDVRGKMEMTHLELPYHERIVARYFSDDKEKR
jgi:NADH-quinone oxidoreductase subunit M